MVTTADVTDRNGAVDMLEYYCDVTGNLASVEKVLLTGVIPAKNLRLL